MRRLVPVLSLAAVVVTAVAACGGDGDDEAAGPATEAAGTTTAPAAGCEPATTDLMTPLGNKLVPEGVRARNGQIAPAKGDPDYLFLSAELDGPGLEEEGDVGTWATTSRFGAEPIYAVDDLAKEHSDWRDVDEVAQLSVEDDGAQASRACAGG